MLIDWFTVGAQVLNFAVLVWLMKRFLYQPVLDAIDAREKRIAAALADAAAQQTQAGAARADFQRRSAELEAQRAGLLTQATQDAAAESQRLLEAARQAAETLRSSRQQALQNESQRLNQALVRRTQLEVLAIARKALAELADASLEDRITQVFIGRLHALGGPEKDTLVQALQAAPGGASGAARVRSAFELPAAQRAAITSAVKDSFASDVTLQFETAPDLVGGIELAVGGQKVAWSIADHLATLQQGVDAWVQGRPAGAAASPAPAPPAAP